MEKEKMKYCIDEEKLKKLIEKLKGAPAYHQKVII